MSDIFEEVDEDVRHDQMVALAKLWGPYVISVVIAIVLGVSGFVGWKSYSEGKLQNESRQFEAAMKDVAAGNFDAAAKGFDALAKTSTSGYALVADLRSATNLLKTGDLDGTAKIWDKVSEMVSENIRLSSLAKLNSAVIMMDLGRNDDARVRLEAISGEDVPFHYTAKELLAFMDYDEGNYVSAQAAYQEMAFSQNIPQGIQKRSKEMLELVEAKLPKTETIPEKEDENNEDVDKKEEGGIK